MVYSKFVIPLAFLAVANVAQAAVVVPKITSVNVTPATATAGTTFKFSAELNNVLPTGYKVKIDTLGANALTAMTGTNTSYSLSRAIFKTGKQNYKVVIVNSKNVVQGTASNGSYTVTSAEPANHAPTLTLVSSDKTATSNIKYTVKLNAKDVDANLGSITMNWGDSTAPDTLTATDSKDLVFSHTYAAEGDFSWNAVATDKGTPTLNSSKVSKIVTVATPLVVKDVDMYSVTQTYDKFEKKTTYVGSDISRAEKDNDTLAIYAFKRADSVTYNIQMVTVNDGRRNYSATWDSNGKQLEVIATPSNFVDCSSYGCIYVNGNVVGVTREYLESIKDTGIDLKFGESGGNDVFFNIPSGYVKKFLAVVPAS